MLLHRALLSVVLAASILACAESKQIHVTIENEQYRAKYIEVLKAKKVNYRLTEPNEIVIEGISEQELENVTEPYRRYVQEDIEKQNRERTPKDTTR